LLESDQFWWGEVGVGERVDVAVLGAGAAGLFCAGLLRQGGLRVVVVDHAPEPGRKILISGGGRANFTNLQTRPEHFLSGNPHFAKSALAGYGPEDFVALVERYGIAYHAKTPGQLFCDGSARQIVEMLVAECAGAALRLGAAIERVERVGDGFRVKLAGTGSAEALEARAVVVATGGLSIPKLGATGFGYEVARQFGLELEPRRAALVPWTFGPEDAERFAGLSGVALEAEVMVGGGAAGAGVAVGAGLRTAGSGREAGRGSGQGSGRGAEVRFRDKVLVTHRGLSGPAVLQASSYWQAGTVVRLDLAPGRVVTGPLLEPKARRDEAAAVAAWSAVLPRRLAERLLALAGPEGWGNAELAAAERALHGWELTPAGTEGYAKAEVTAGGVATGGLDARTMEAKGVPGLYFIGEVVDVTGQLGGFNFQWAWASGAAAARGILRE
jgi:predicted flavoprotein YhiN